MKYMVYRTYITAKSAREMQGKHYVEQIIDSYILGVCEDGWKIKNLEPGRVKENT